MNVAQLSYASVVVLALSISFAPGHARSEDEPSALSAEPSALSADEAGKLLANPNNSLASLTFRNQYRAYAGDLPGARSEGNYTMLFQPVFPFVFEKDEGDNLTRKLFVRPAIPFQVDQPVFDPRDGDFSGETGLGDIGFDIAYGASWDSGAQLAVGMVGTLPTATGSVPGGNAALGPELFAGIAGRLGFAGFLLTHQWDISSWSDADVDKTTLQPIFTYLLEDGWAVGSSPILEYDWVTDQATIPVNAFVQKTVTFGSTPTRFQLEFSYYPERSDVFGPQFFIGLNITPVVPNIFQR